MVNCKCFNLSASHRRRTTALRQRRGAMYVSVLLTSLIVSVTTLAGLKMLELRVTSQAGGNDASRARQISDSGIALALARLNQQTDWRTRYKSSMATSPELFDGGSFWYSLTNVQNDLTQVGDGLATLTVHSRFGQAGHARTVKIVPTYLPAEILKASIYVHQDISIDTSGSISTDGAVWTSAAIRRGGDAIQASEVRSNDTLQPGSGNASEGLVGATLGAVTGVVSQATGSLLGSATLGNNAWLEEYAYIGTEIPYGSLPGGKIERVLLSPTNNPYGPISESGVYFIRCNGGKVEITKARIEGTLVLFDCKSDSVVKDQVHWQAFTPGMPTLVAGGSFQVKTKDEQLSESSTKRNFNPSHSPYRGIGDADESDFYPSQILGPMIINGDLTIDTDGPLMVHGGIYVMGQLTQKSHLRVQRDDRLLDSPPPGLRTENGVTVRNGTLTTTATDNTRL